MQVRFSSWALLPAAVALIIAGCTNPSQVDSISVTPSVPPAVNISQTIQFTATGTYNHSAPHPPTQQDLTNAVTWTSSNTQVATISATGLATAKGAGTSIITASINGFTGLLTSTATMTVTVQGTGNGSGNGNGNGNGTGTGTEQLLSINIIPGDVTVSNKGMTAQYLAFGTFSTPPLVRDITNEVTWISLLPEVASINSGGTPGELAGLATAQGYTGFTDIYAIDTKSNQDGTVVLSNANTFTCKDPITSTCNQAIAHSEFATISVYVVGENTFVPNMSQIGPDNLPYGEYVTGPSDTGTPNLIHCDGSANSPISTGGTASQWTAVGGTGGVVCTGTYETGSTITLTENLPANSAYFGGWSAGDGATPNNTCQEPNLATSTTCTLTLDGNMTVGVIFY